MAEQPYRNPDVRNFLDSLRMYLSEALPPLKDVPIFVEEEAKAIGRVGAKTLFREGAFLSRCVTPSIHSFLISKIGLSDQEATDSLISENTIDRKRGIANKRRRTQYPLPHPFRKSIGASASKVIDSWYNKSKPLSTKHPDMCLTRPFPILFEAKYRVGKTSHPARQDLIETIYETFFYLGLPSMHDARSPWVYDFAVALMYDGSNDAALTRAWEDLPQEVRDSLWNAANLYVMVLRGRE